MEYSYSGKRVKALQKGLSYTIISNKYVKACKHMQEVFMARTVAIGIQDYADVIKSNYFYVDKTSFIKEWWESGDSVTLIARPRRFGKTLLKE